MAVADIALYVAILGKLGIIPLAVTTRPRKTLGFQTPASKLQQSVASTV
jgi:hypothetical protein